MTDDNVQVKITADTAQANNNIKETGDVFENMSSRMRLHLGLLNESFGAAKEILEAFAAAFAIEKVAEFVNEIAEMGEQIQRAAAMTGLSTTAIQEFQFAVKLTGGNVESAATTLEHLEHNMSLASQTSSQSAQAFKAMGIAALDVNGQLRPVSTVLSQIADYFKAHADGAAKTALAMDLMGRSGAALIPVLNKGSEGLAELNSKLKETGDEMSASTVDKFAELKENITELDTAWEGFKISVDNLLEPAAKKIISWLTAITESLTSYINNIKLSIDLTEEMFRRMAGGTQTPIAAATPLPQAATPLSQQQINDAKKLSEEKLKLHQDELSSMDGQTDVNNQHLLAIGAITQSQLLDMQRDNLNQRAQLENQYYEKKLAAAKGDLLEQTKILDEQTKYNTKVNTELAKINAKKSEDSLKDWMSLRDSVTTGFQSMTEKLIRGTATFKDAFKQMCGDLVIEFAKMQVKNVAMALWASVMQKGYSIEAAITQRFASATTAAANTYASVAAIPLVGWLMAPPAAAAAFAGVMAFGLPSAAGGWGEVPQDGLAMIHKKEMVLPAAIAEKVRNMTTTANSGNTYHFNISALDGNSVKQMFMNNGSALMQAINNQVRNNNRMAT